MQNGIHLYWAVYTLAWFHIKLVRVLKKIKKVLLAWVGYVNAKPASEIGRANEP